MGNVTALRTPKWWLSPLSILLLGIPAVQPLFSNQLTCGFDTTFHLWRAVEMANLQQNGLLFSRWAPAMAHGYGYPLFLFQSPLSAMATAVLAQLGFSWITAVNSMYIFGVLGAGLTTWWLARDFWGEQGGILAASAMIYAPFHSYIVLYRASLSETVAWVFPPLVLWGLYRWQILRQRMGIITAVLALAALFFTHDVSAYTFLPLFLVWAAAWGWQNRSWQRFRQGVFALLLGIGAGAFFWLPALVERGSIQFERAGTAWPFLYVNNFLPLNQLLALPRNADPLLLNDWPSRGLGMVLFAFVLLGIWRGWRLGGALRRVTAVLAFALFSYLFITQPASQFFWDRISLLAAFQFPWRFLAPVTLAAALLIGAITATPQMGHIRQSSVKSTLLLIGAITGLSVLQWGWLYPDHCDPPSNISLAGMVTWEKETDTVGSTASGELLPTAVRTFPEEPGTLPPWEARLLLEDMPDGAQIVTAVYPNPNPLSASFEIESPIPFTARYRAFYFPGWKATINGNPVPIIPSEPEGLITFAVPNGRSTITVTFTETPLRRLANIITLASLITLLALTTLTPSRLHALTPPPAHPFTPSSVHLFIPLALILLKLLMVDGQHTPIHQTRLQEDGTLAGVSHPMTLTFGDAAMPNQLRLLGYDEIDTAVPADQPLVVTLYWQALAPLTADYRVGLTLLDVEGNRWSDIDLRDYRWLRNPPPTQAWPLDHYVRTSFFVDSLPGTPPGTYQLQLSLFEKESLTPLTVYDETHQPLGPAFDLTAVTLTAPDKKWAATDLEMQFTLPSSGGDVQLVGSSVGLRVAAPGDPLLMTLFYKAAQPGQLATLALWDETETAVAQWQLTFSQAGESVWRMQQRLQLPANLNDGEYTWHLETVGGTAVQWGTLAINAPERLFKPPEVDLLYEAALGKHIQLYGTAGVPETAVSGETIMVTLVWQSRESVPDSYRVFVHLINSSGELVAQSDTIPANWTRPTTGWQVGEYILDTHKIQLPPTLAEGEYALFVGMVQPNNSRLMTEKGEDMSLLQIISIAK